MYRGSEGRETGSVSWMTQSSDGIVWCGTCRLPPSQLCLCHSQHSLVEHQTGSRARVISFIFDKRIGFIFRYMSFS